MVVKSDDAPEVRRRSASTATHSVSFSAQEGSAPSLNPGSPGRSKPRKNFKRSQHHFSPRCSRRSIAGVRQLRRLANLAFLLDQTELEADESGQVDLVDLVEVSRSGFTELFEVEEKMSLWNEFVDCSEEEQREILSRAKRAEAQRRRRCYTEGNTVDEQFEELSLSDADSASCTDNSALMERVGGGDLNLDTKDRLGHSAQQCFQRISHNLRTFLRRGQYPRGELLALEDELVTFFSEWPCSVYVTRLSDGFRRLLLHAVSQYLDLHASSFDVEGGSRHTQVENRGRRARAGFVAPAVPLATFLSDLKG